MKATLLFTALSMVFAMPTVSAKTEIETLRARCSEQEKKIHQLEQKLQQLQGDQKPTTAPDPTSTAATPVEKSSTPASKSYVVKAGDSVEKIARNNGCSVASLTKINGLTTSTIIRPGQRLKLPGAVVKKSDATKTLATYPADRKATSFEPVAEQSPKPKAPEAAHATTAAIRPVQLGNSTSTPIIAAKSTAPAPAPPKTAETAAAPAKAKSNEEAKPSASPNTERKIRSIKIESQMTYGQFATNHGTDVTRLNDLNGLDLTTATVLAKGSELYVPAQP